MSKKQLKLNIRSGTKKDEDLPHGKEGRYRRGCRCDKCCQWKRDSRK